MLIASIRWSLPRRTLLRTFYNDRSAMNWSVSTLTSISSDTEPTIVLTFDNAKYIFNVGENTSRSFIQSKHNWRGIKGLFLTQLGTKRAGGLCGMLMTITDGSAVSAVDVIGPTGILHQLASMRSYLFRPTISVRVMEAQPVVLSNPEPVYKDEYITVYGIPLTPAIEQGVHLLRPDDTPLKRKRSITPDRPSKRAVVTASYDNPSANPTLDQTMSTPGFSPSSLSGTMAQDWKTSMLNMIFPANKKNHDIIKKEAALARKKKKGKGEINVSESQAGPPKQPDPEPSGNVDSYKRPHAGGLYDQLPTFSYPGAGTPDAPPTLAYVIVGPRIRGKFDAKRARELGIPNGPLRKQLIDGNTITFKRKLRKVENGTAKMIEVEQTVRPEECVGESETPAVILILDIPSPAYIPSLVSSFDETFFAKFRVRSPGQQQEHVVRTIFHIVGEGVLEDERYIQFMRSFDEDDEAIHHLVASREYCPDPVTFTSAASNQLRLNQLDESIFAIPKYSPRPAKDISKIPNLPRSTQPMVANQTISMRPLKPPIIETPVHDNFHPAMEANVSVSLPARTARMFMAAKKSVERALKHNWRHSRSPGSNKSSSGSDGDSAPVPQRGRDVGVLPLGTGSAGPSKYRNTSGTLISIPGWGNVLLDSGEGTWGQLVRQYGLGQGPTAGTSSDVWQVLRDLKLIYISHIHADHHAGVANILAKRKLLDPPPKDPLYLVGIELLHLYLRELSDLQNLGIAFDHTVGIEKPSLGSDVVCIMSEALHWKHPDAYLKNSVWEVHSTEPWTDIQRSRRLAVSLCHSLGLQSLHSVDMFHRVKCYGLVMKHQDDWSIVFSGDTSPTNALVSAGRNATLLIHEATMADGAEELALKRAHSTFGQGISVGKSMKAEHILLTHFSSRYPKIPPMDLGTTMPDKISEDPADSDESSGKEESGDRSPTPSGAIMRRQKPAMAIAFDHMNLTIGDIWKMDHYLPAITQSFIDTLEEGDDEVDESGAREVV